MAGAQQELEDADTVVRGLGPGGDLCVHLILNAAAFWGSSRCQRMLHGGNLMRPASWKLQHSGKSSVMAPCS